MIYAKDQWIQMPVRDLYDSQIMMASINAAKDMYEKGLQEMKDFKNAYENFTSPIEKDVEYWNNNTIKPVREAVDKIYAMGIDPTKNAEARAYISQLINRVPVAELNKRKQSAAVANEYLKNKADLEAKGLYNEDYERAQLGGKTLQEWDTSDGIWSRTSPSQFLNMTAATSDYFKDLKPTDKGFNNRGMRVVSIDDNDLLNVAKNNIESFKQTSLGKYYYQKAKEQIANANPGFTNEDINNRADELLISSMAGSQTSKKFYDEKEDPIFMANYRNKLAMQLDDYKVKNDRRRVADQLQLQQQYQNPTITPLTYTDAVDSASQTKLKQSKLDNLTNTLKKAKSYYESQMSSILKRADINKDGKVDANEAKSWQTAYNALSPEQKKKYNKYANEYKKLTRYNKEWALVEKHQNDSPEVRSKYTLTMTNADFDKYDKLAWGTSNSYKSDNTTSAINKAFGRHEISNLTDSQTKTASTVLARGAATKSPWSGKYRTIDVSNSSNVRFSPIQKGNAVGGRVYRYSSLQRKLDRHLSNKVKTLYLVNNGGMSIADVGKYRYTTGYGTVPLSQVINFNGQPTNTEDAKRQLQSIGVQIVRRDGEIPNGNEPLNELVAKIPVTDRSPIGGLMDAETNSEHARRVYGTKNASDYEVNYQAKALQQGAALGNIK